MMVFVGSRGVLGGRAKASINKAEQQRGCISFLSLHTTHLSPIPSISYPYLLPSSPSIAIHITREKEKHTEAVVYE